MWVRPDHDQQVKAAWGRQYRGGRLFHRLAGIPALTTAGLKVLDNVNHPKFRAQLLLWESTLSGN